MKIKNLLDQSKQKLQGYSPTPDLDSEILLSSILEKNREFLFSHPDLAVSKKDSQKFNQLIIERIKQEPIAYIVGEKNFYGRTFTVNSATLIPRPETELIIEKVLEYYHREIYLSKNTFLIDIGTGSGCIVISLIKELQKTQSNFSALKAVGTDLSAKALVIARKNSKKFETKNQINFLEGNLLEPTLKKYPAQPAPEEKSLKDSQLIITANLPYLSQDIYKNCPKSVLQFEPQKALLADKNGLGLYIELLNQIKTNHLDQLAWNIYLIFEISPEQKELVEKEFKKIFPNIQMRFSQDFAQKYRFIEIFFK